MTTRHADVASRPRWQATGAAAVLTAFLLAAGTARAVDLIGDGMADVLWRLPAGNPLIWEMSGLSIQSQITVPPALNAGSAIAGTGRFFGTNAAGAILWINSSDQLTLWQIGSGGNVRQSCTVASNINPNLDFLGIGDIDADGTDDVLWLNRMDGSVNAFLMNGCKPPQILTLQATADPAWTFAGAGDVNGDGSTDLFWQDGAANTLIEWLVAPDGTVTQQNQPEGDQGGWQIVAIADFDGGGKADLLWRDPASQSLAMWHANGDGTFETASIEPSSSNTFAAADDIFGNGFDALVPAAPELDSSWTILAAADFDGDGSSDLLLADRHGNTAIWLMHGATVRATGLFPPTSPDMPLPDITGWRLPLDRPTVTKANGNVSVIWKTLPGTPTYSVYGSASNNPVDTGSIVSSAPPPLSFTRSEPGFASEDRYFAVGAAYHGMVLPATKEAYIVEFTPVISPYYGQMSVTNLVSGCPGIFRAIGDCHGRFAAAGIGALGLDPLYSDVNLRDVRFADFNGDGIPDFVANVYSCDASECGGPTANSQILLFFGNPDGTFTEDTSFALQNIPGGYGETILVADFNNDGCLDIFLPQYTFYDPSEQNYLLTNDCHGNFTDVADAAGVAQRDANEYLRTEGAQALDINGDGWIDIYAGSQLFINNGDGTFTNVGITDDASGMTSVSPWGLPEQFDEGAKFIDWDNSGQLSLVLNAVDGIRVFKFDGVGNFTEESVIPSIYMNESWGLTAADVDGDGRTDIVVAGGIDQSVESSPAYRDLKAKLDSAREKGDLDMDEVLDTSKTPNAPPQLLVNRGQFLIHDFYDDGSTPMTRGWNDLQTFADFDFSGTTDIATLYGPDDDYPLGHTAILLDQATSPDVITVTVLGANGEQNQQGRVVRVTPDARPNVTMTQVVDSGSGYMSNGPYDMTFATPYFGAYTFSVRLADATYTAVARSGDHVTIYANGTYAIQSSR
jgi:hypothetical protein